MAMQILTLDAPVTTVTLLEDRAQVQRLTTIHLTPGLWRVTVTRITPVLTDKSLRAEFIGDDGNARVNDVRIRRQMLTKETDLTGLVAELNHKWRNQSEQYEILTEERRELEEQFAQISRILVHAVQELPEDAAWGQVEPMWWQAQLQPIFHRLREIRSKILNAYHTQVQLQEAITRLAQRINVAVTPATTYTAQLEADLEISQPGAYQLAFDYVVPNALWRPYHQAQLRQTKVNQTQDQTQLDPTPSDQSLTATSSAPDLDVAATEHLPLVFRTDGCVWQNTGEDWLNVDLIFSTARASLGIEPPLLSDDRLSIQEKAKKLVVQLREQPINTTGLGKEAKLTDTVTVDLPGVDDGGEVRTIRASTKANIPTDGRPYRIPLFAFATTATVERVLMAEVTPQVVIKSEQTNQANLPILAGPVDLVRGTEYIGRTTINFVAPQEKFALSWGTDATMRVQRTTARKQDKNHLTQWTTITNTINIFLSNIGDTARLINLTERVPVSELEKIKIEVIPEETTDYTKPDNHGFCRWQLPMAPYTQAKVVLVYRVAAAPDVDGL